MSAKPWYYTVVQSSLWCSDNCFEKKDNRLSSSVFTNTHTHTQFSISSLCLDKGFFLKKECFFTGLCVGIYLFLSPSGLIWKAVFHTSFGSPVSLLKEMEWLANQWPSHPTNLESSISQSDFTRPEVTFVSGKDTWAHYEWFCLSSSIMKERC